jgi:branched-chain amino acid transport system ATP-binding protein
MTDRMALQTNGLEMRFGGVLAVDGVTLGVQPGEIHAIIGPNGAGKTTLLNLLSGELLSTGGIIHLGSLDVTRMSADQRSRAGMGRSFQHSSIFENFSTRENVRLAAQSRLPSSFSFLRNADKFPEINTMASGAIEALGLNGCERLAGEISHGEQRQLEIAMILATGSKLILLDEPTSGMGRVETQQLIVTLRKLRGHHTIILVEHDMDLVFALADRVTVLVYGKVIATGTCDEVRALPSVRSAYLGHGQ